MLFDAPETILLVVPSEQFRPDLLIIIIIIMPSHDEMEEEKNGERLLFDMQTEHT